MSVGIAPESVKEVVLFLATAGVVVPLFTRLRVSPVLGFLAAGALLGPFGLGRLATDLPWLAAVTITEPERIAPLAEFGVVFLLFMIGIELSWDRLRRLRRLVFGFGTLQILTCAAVLALPAWLVGLRPTAALLVGLALALSSTAIVMPVMAERKRLATPAGRTTFSVLLMQDLAVAPILFGIAVVATFEGPNAWLQFALALGKASLAILAIFRGWCGALRPLFQVVAGTRSSELFMAASLLVVLGTALLAAATGLSMALGAFIAGLLLAETEYRRAIEATIEPFKGLLLGVFFVSVGMGLDIARLAASPVFVLYATVGLLITKGALIYALARLFRLDRSVALETAMVLAAGGEFAFVILGTAASGNLFPSETVQALLLVVTLSMMLVPVMARLAGIVSRRLERDREVPPEAAEPPPASDQPRVLIAGFGRVGQLVAEMLERHAVPYLAIDQNPSRVAEQRRAGRPVYYGDSSNADFLRRCGIVTATGLVVTLDVPAVVENVVRAARSQRRDLCIVARARDARQASALYDLGVDDAVPETIEASLQLSEAVLVDIGVPMGRVIASVHERRDEFRRSLRRQDGENGAVEVAQFRSRRSAQV